MTHESTNRPRASIVNRPRAFIDILDDDSLLTIFYHCRPPVLLVEGDGDRIDLFGGRWECKHWWCELTWVCRKWRRLMHTSPSYLGISLLCRPGTPVSRMLASFPLIIDHVPPDDHIPAAGGEGIIFALKHRNRVRRIRLQVFVPSMTRLIEALDEEFPLLEYLYIKPPMSLSNELSLPVAFGAPHLRHLVLFNFTFPIGSSFLAGLVALSLRDFIPPANFGPNTLLQQLSLMPHLETFVITFHPCLPSQNVTGGLWQIPLSTQYTLPNLRWLGFGGPSALMEAVLPRITMPLLKVTEIIPVGVDILDLTSFILFILQSVWEDKKPRPCNVELAFDFLGTTVVMHPHQPTGMTTLRFQTSRLYYDRIVDATAQVIEKIQTVLTEVGVLTLKDNDSRESFAVHSQWRELLRPFNQVRTLHVSGYGLIEGLCHSLRQHDRESGIELLPMLSVLSCPKGTHIGESCRSFLAARQTVGFPVTISYH